MSPQSRRSQPAGGTPGGSGQRRGAAAPPPNALFAELLRAARELLAVRSPLDAELMVSELLGTWWGQRGGGRRAATVEQLVGEGLVDYAGAQHNPAALALLSGIACLGTSRQAAKAERAALELIEAGVPCPGWAEHLGAVTSAECYVNPDDLGDTDEVICVFSYAGEEPHALVTVVDYNADGMLKDGWVTSRVGKLLDHCRESSSQRGAAGKYAFRQADAGQARHMLETALTVTDTKPDPAVSESFPSYHAFIRARIRALPPYRGRSLSATGERRHAWSKDRRAMLAAEFLASDEAEDLSDIKAASRCADHIVDYGCDQDFGRPLRVSPAKVETYLLDWLPRKVMLTASEQHAMPHVLVAWARWAGARSGLDISAISKTLDAVFDAMPTFGKVYRDPASFGLEPGLVERLLPDHDLEALPRRAFAFGVLDGVFHGTNLRTLDPASAQDRLVLLAADHDDSGEEQVAPGHLEGHAAIAERLWRGDPPELWEAAQRLLDLGMPRHDVVHVLIDAIEAAGTDDRAIRLALGDLPPESAD